MPNQLLTDLPASPLPRTRIFVPRSTSADPEGSAYELRSIALTVSFVVHTACAKNSKLMSAAVLILPTEEAIETLANQPKGTNAILHVTC
jgi:hypothetical protein